ncbi:UDP-glucose--hexose-1-phosphate uridylyltransferase [Clostridium thermarum]|uniref:UDP-glucose--hexose-1-phosphate uridylyltransferase n=1 Tax=Clostridium thermarum TaxID=1716543 RepID=UPI0013D24BFF|nr:UDP-glucose--hexose-1-phosphate uridylyltransferase [Clostridium thermarum]
MNCAKEIERLLNFAVRNNLIEKYDIVQTRNSLLELFKLTEPYTGKVEEEIGDSPADILENLLDYAAELGLLEVNTTTYRDLLDAKIMGLLMPRQSEVIRRFETTAREKGIKSATDDFYVLSKASNYIRMDRIEKNLYWQSPTDYGNIEITINLSKPEKDPRDIAAAKALPQSNYPKCLLCIENVGFAGNVNHPARQNHRVIPVTVAEEQWYLQYSPYVYYNEHCILFKGEHEPMQITDKTFRRLLDFIEQFPHYFIGSNADLPIVGGSILSHEHFQGGRHVFPMETAPEEVWFTHSKYKDVKVSIVKWPMSVIRAASKDKNRLVEFSVELLEAWKHYSDESADILAFTEKEGMKIPHNTITPIVRRNKLGEYEIDLVLRNNRTSDEHPDGIFHPHVDLHHIKKENIGLIEVMGLAVLPARLETELKKIESILLGNVGIEKIGEQSDLYKHKGWIEEMLAKYGMMTDGEKAKELLKQEVGEKFLKVLMDAGVYKRNSEGMVAFKRFMATVGFIEVK